MINKYDEPCEQYKETGWCIYPNATCENYFDCIIAKIKDGEFNNDTMY